MKEATYIYDDEILKYRFNDTHPFNQMRVKMTTDLLMSAQFLQKQDIVKPRIATEAELELVHSKSFIDAVRKAGHGELDEKEASKFGLGTNDTPIFDNMHERSKLLVGATLTAVEAVMEGNSRKALSLAGGLHHGFSGRSSGFCIYNDTAVAIEFIRKKFGKKVLYIDTDAHHGDGTQYIFYSKDDVMTYSVHETGRYLFPGTGHITELGDDIGYGYSINLPLDAYTEDDSFKHVFSTSLERAIERFKPDVIFSQNGVDSHFRDPMTHLNLTSESFEYIPRFVDSLAKRYTDGKWIAVGGGGYNLWEVVPRMWAQVWLAMTGETAPRGQLPKEFIETYKSKCPSTFPMLWEDALHDYIEIPRRTEITEKNIATLERLMNHL
ncbi:acetoin utilization protein AcuC [Aliicoccus persicus]|uniref:Acetoin utilization protein AcuC n=1 Tax=Aliicoccus persicus TaxID=930138 RepID=A0A662Z577_9STAP|nr:acetoin utilization protein AcuC [Aliicoccus persicus]SEV87610.1 acetoin utilization protein AcuC [Aliicoccus persicus]HJE19976.1 acetoin utilization protein AcuC [Aliicoccus persicus]